MLYNVIWVRGVVKNMTFSCYIIYGWPLAQNHVHFFFSVGFYDGRRIFFICSTVMSAG